MQFKKAYLEPSIINREYGCRLSGLKLKEVLEKHLLAPAIGLHTIYEIARTFLSKDGKQRGAALFQILWGLDPHYQPSPEMLHDREIIKLRTGATVLPFLDELDLAATRQVVWRLASGFSDKKYINIIAQREAEIRENYPKYASGYIDEIKDTLNQNPSESLRTFEDVYSNFQDQVPDLIYQSLNGKVTLFEAHEIYQ